jgi:hypothetical protein
MYRARRPIIADLDVSFLWLKRRVGNSSPFFIEGRDCPVSDPKIFYFQAECHSLSLVLKDKGIFMKRRSLFVATAFALGVVASPALAGKGRLAPISCKMAIASAIKAKTALERAQKLPDLSAAQHLTIEQRQVLAARLLMTLDEKKLGYRNAMMITAMACIHPSPSSPKKSYPSGPTRRPLPPVPQALILG